jgi:mannose-6-phosphate isomerase-like protein (cupin superfamily)
MRRVLLLPLLLAAAPLVDLLPADAGVRLIALDASKPTRVELQSERALAVLDGQAVLAESGCLELKAHQSGVVLVLPAQKPPAAAASCEGKALSPEGEYPVGTIGKAKFLGHAPFAYAGELSLEPNAEVKPHQHDGSDEIILIQSGAGTFTLAGQTRKVAKGDAVRVPKGTVHGFVAGPQPVQVIQFYSPAGPEERFRAAKK